MNRGNSLGFTLVEVMFVVVIVAIIAAITIPSYQAQVRRANANQAEQTLLNLAAQLERHKARNFSYRGFITTIEVLPQGATAPNIRYNIEVASADNGNPLLTANAATGRNWAIRAFSVDPRNFSYLIRSDGTRCRSLTTASVTFENCGATGSESW